MPLQLMHESQLLCVGHSTHSCVTPRRRGIFPGTDLSTWLVGTEYRRLVSSLVLGLGINSVGDLYYCGIGYSEFFPCPALLSLLSLPREPFLQLITGTRTPASGSASREIDLSKLYANLPWKSESGPSCLTLCNPMFCSPSGSSVLGDSPGKNTGVACHSRLQGSSWPRDQTQVACIVSRFFTVWATREPK